MKRIILLFVFISMTFSLCACAGNVKNAKTHEVPSELYTEDDINAAIETIKEEFTDWHGCTLTEIYYAGDDTSRAEQAYRKSADEVLVLLSSFDVDWTGYDGSFNPNSTYGGWKWILVRQAGGRWQHVDHGY